MNWEKYADKEDVGYPQKKQQKKPKKKTHSSPAKRLISRPFNLKCLTVWVWILAICELDFGSSHLFYLSGNGLSIGPCLATGFLAFSSISIWLSKLTFHDRPGYIHHQDRSNSSVGTQLRMWHLLKSSWNFAVCLS